MKPRKSNSRQAPALPSKPYFIHRSNPPTWCETVGSSAENRSSSCTQMTQCYALYPRSKKEGEGGEVEAACAAVAQQGQCDHAALSGDWHTRQLVENA
jgi:hypothetical protein